MTDRGRVIEYLTAWPFAMSRDEVEPRLVDDDLWLAEPNLRSD